VFLTIPSLVFASGSRGCCSRRTGVAAALCLMFTGAISGNNTEIASDSETRKPMAISPAKLSSSILIDECSAAADCGYPREKDDWLSLTYSSYDLLESYPVMSCIGETGRIMAKALRNREMLRIGLNVILSSRGAFDKYKAPCNHWFRHMHTLELLVEPCFTTYPELSPKDEHRFERFLKNLLSGKLKNGCCWDNPQNWVAAQDFFSVLRYIVTGFRANASRLGLKKYELFTEHSVEDLRVEPHYRAAKALTEMNIESYLEVMRTLVESSLSRDKSLENTLTTGYTLKGIEWMADLIQHVLRPMVEKYEEHIGFLEKEQECVRSRSS